MNHTSSLHRAPKPVSNHPRRRRYALLGVVSAAVLGLAPAVQALSDTSAPQQATADAGTTGLFSSQVPRDAVVASSPEPTTVGLRFSPKVDGKLVGMQVLKLARSSGATPTTGTLWSSSGQRLASAQFSPTRTRGWLSVKFARPVDLTRGRTYTVSAFAPHGRYAVTRQGFTQTRSTDALTAPGDRNGVHTLAPTPVVPTSSQSHANYWVDVLYQPVPTVPSVPTVPVPPTTSTPPPPPPTTSTPPPPPPTTSTPPPPSNGSWPGPDNTGVPAGTTLTPYSGPCTITSSVTLNAVDATSKCGEILVRAPNVVITKSKLPRVDATNAGNNSVTLTDDTVLGGHWSDGAIWGYNITATRVDVTGGQHTFHCNDNCTVVDSWLHDQWNPDGQGYHNNAFISNGGTNMLIRHNTLHCTPLLNATDGGCSGDLSLFGDFDPISHVTIDHNLFKANNSSISYCLYAGWNPGKSYGDNPTYIQVTNNVWERGANNKCGVYGPVTSFKSSGTGNTWSNNTWTDGAVVNPAA